MGKITWNSTFKDVQELLIDEDETFIKQLEYLNSDQFQKATDMGYLQRNFHFFMAIVLQGVTEDQSVKHSIKFLQKTYPNQTKPDSRTWRRNVGNFVDGKGNIDTKINDALNRYLVIQKWMFLKPVLGSTLLTAVKNLSFGTPIIAYLSTEKLSLNKK